MKSIGIVFACCLLAACQCDENRYGKAACDEQKASKDVQGFVTQPPPPVAQQPAKPPPAQSTAVRVTVERIGVVGDSLAYTGSRGVYVIRDNETGREFIGVSGIGIAETGSHKSGKSTVADER